ncbi:hypothetical protein [Nocardia sp. alder85J]|uniref:hypothetical protein n=1 Tax=Nocardia sp. alder85J TaxID=2862949 RepID=UPI001CD21A9D|nr:hypothetical protein [Nocardia sp. alder85J]MCX4094000.1 hypothetical protein [Nocardia sp. alder85J]
MSKFMRTGLVALAIAFPILGAAPAQADEPTLIMLGGADDSRTITAATGDLVRVLLVAGHDEEGSWAWSDPASSDTGVLQRRAGRPTRGGTAESIFTVVGPGRGELFSARSCVPDPGRDCPADPVPWQVTIVAE